MSRIRSGGRSALPISVMVVAVAVLLAGCGSGEPSGTATLREPPASASANAPERDGDARPFPRRPGPVEPGRYATTAFKPGFAVTMGPGWQVLFADEHGFFSLARGQETLVAFERPVRMVDPSRTYAKDLPPDALVPAPADLVAWHEKHPRLTTGPRRQASVGGRKATRFDVRVRNGYRSAGCPAPCVLFSAPTPEIVSVATEGQVIRSFLVDAEGAPLLISVLSSEEGFEAAVREAQQVLASLEFEP